jgi:hypothetical protein
VRRSSRVPRRIDYSVSSVPLAVLDSAHLIGQCLFDGVPQPNNGAIPELPMGIRDPVVFREVTASSVWPYDH